MTSLELETDPDSDDTVASKQTSVTTKECPGSDCEGTVVHVSTSEPSYECRDCHSMWLTSSVEFHNTE